MPELARRVKDGRDNHDYLARKLSESGYFDVPQPLNGESRAPDSIQFNLKNFSDDQCHTFVNETAAAGVKAQIFGLSQDNARAFWNWEFLEDVPDLPTTRAMLMRACDVRLPARLTQDEVDYVSDVLVSAARMSTG